MIKTYDDLDIELELDFDYSVGEIHIHTMEEFRKHLLLPYLDPETNLYYRGERINQLSRPLLPTLLRKKDTFMDPDDYYKHLDGDWILEYYSTHKEYFNLYNNLMGKADTMNLYDICAFSQHYINMSPFIDLTKSLSVALSFGLKNKTVFEDDAILYVIDASNDEYFTRDKETAEQWLDAYSIDLYNTSAAPKPEDKPLVYTAPVAKIIDIATNDLMKFQKGAFLLLTDFSLSNQLYLTRNVRDSLSITKYHIDKSLCPQIVKQINTLSPWYSFDKLINMRQSLNDIF